MTGDWGNQLRCPRTSILLTGAIGLLLGCTSGFKRNEPGAGYGQIVVGSPRIEGRERLINDRRDQERWLQGRLEALDGATFGVSGAVELNSLALTALQAGVVRDPALRLDALNRERDAAQIRQAADDESTLRSFRNSARDQILARFNKGELTAEQAKAELEKIGLALPPTGASSAVRSTASAASAADRAVKSVALGEKPERAVPPSNDPRRAALQSTPIEDFDDRLAARERIRNELNDIRLDDLHDLSGNTLYRMTFDTTVFPTFDDSSAWAVVSVKVPLKITTDSQRLTDLLERAEDQFLRSLRDGTEIVFRSVANRMADTCYQNEAKVLLAAQKSDEKTQLATRREAFRRAFGCASFYIGSTTRRALERQLSAWPQGWKFRSPAAPARMNLMTQLDGTKRDVGDPAELELRREVLGLWAEWLGEVFDMHLRTDFDGHVLRCFNTLQISPQPATTINDFFSPAFVLRQGATSRTDLGSSDGPFLLRLEPILVALPPALQRRCGNETGTDRVARFRKLLERNAAASVYAVTPKESVQRLSEVASNRKVNEMLLNFSTVTSAVGLNAGLQSLRANDGFYQALRRQPLAVGMTERGRARLVKADDSPAGDRASELVFGWVLGPSFQISPDGKETRFRHAVSQKPVAAELSLPAWIDAVDVTVSARWVREDGTDVSEDRRTADQRTPVTFTVDLPVQPVEALAAIDERYLREPRIDTFQEIRVVEGEAANVLITGRNVWRSTDVFIGSQRSSSLSVLPDNRGVVARFASVDPPHGSYTPSAKRDEVVLNLVTAEGRVDAGRVTIVPKEAKTKAAPSSKLEGITTRIVAGLEQRMVLPAAVGAGEDAVVRIGSSQDQKLAVLLTATTQFDEDRRTLLFALPRASVPNLKAGSPIRAELVVKKLNGIVELLDLVKDGVFYESEDQAKASASAKRANQKSPIVLTITLPKSATKAFKDLAAGTLKVQATVTLPDKSQHAGEVRCSLVKDACSTELRVTDAFAAKLAALSKPDGIKVGVALVGDDVPALKETEVVLQ